MAKKKPQPEDVIPAEQDIATAPEAQGIDAILEERGSRYGSFVRHAFLTQQIKWFMENHDKDKWNRLSCDQAEALQMIAHKIGRIVNGDPDYIDSWDDIAGYAKLVADRLRGLER